MPVALEKKKTIIQTVEEEKNELAIKLLSLKDKAIVHAFKVIFEDLTSTTKKATKVQYNKEIDAAVKRVRNGKSVSNDQVMNEMDKW
jgi:hypothetical protein